MVKMPLPWDTTVFYFSSKNTKGQEGIFEFSALFRLILAYFALIPVLYITCILTFPRGAGRDS